MADGSHLPNLPARLISVALDYIQSPYALTPKDRQHWLRRRFYYPEYVPLRALPLIL
jgi:hypothetical protein